jgi:transposase
MGGNAKGSKQADDTLKASVVASFEAGMSYKEIEEKYDVPERTAQRWMARYRAEKTVERAEGSGRKRKTTSSEDRHIVLTVLRDRDTTSAEVVDGLGDRSLSSRLIRRRIAELTDLKSHWKIKKPFINARNRRRRVRWCMDRLHYTPEQWKRFLFTDESKFTLRFSQKTRVWRTKEELYEPFAMTGTVKHDDHMGSVTYIELMGYLSKTSIMRSFEINSFHRLVNFSIIEIGLFKKIMIRSTLQTVQRLFITNFISPVRNGPQIVPI